MVKAGALRISISLPSDLLNEFDKISKQRGYNDRSKSIRAAMLSFITESKWMYEEREVVAGAIVMVYDHQTKGLEEMLTDIQHHHEKTVRSSMHIHLDEKNCLEIIAVKGSSEEIKSLAKKMNLRGVKQLKQAIM